MNAWQLMHFFGCGTFRVKTNTVLGQRVTLPSTQIFAKWKTNMIPLNLWHFNNEKLTDTASTCQLLSFFNCLPNFESSFPCTRSAVISFFSLYSWKFSTFRCFFKICNQMIPCSRILAWSLLSCGLTLFNLLIFLLRQYLIAKQSSQKSSSAFSLKSCHSPSFSHLF